MSRRTDQPTREDILKRRNVDAYAPHAYKVFMKCDPPVEWGEREFWMLLWAALEPDPLDHKNENIEPKDLRRVRETICDVMRLYATAPDAFLKVLCAFRRLIEQLHRSPVFDALRSAMMDEAMLRMFERKQMPGTTRKALWKRCSYFWKEKAETLATKSITPKVIEHARKRLRNLRPFVFPPRKPRH